MRITTYFGLPQGHATIPFVDIRTDDDTRLFIDPCLIERCTDPLSYKAAAIMANFADQLYKDMRSGRWATSHTVEAAHEVHETKLGYGNGRNGKGKTPEGMRISLNGLCFLANGIPSISRIQDMSVFVEDFAEDCMSDLLANLLRPLLCQFTAEQMSSFGIHPSGEEVILYWDCVSHRWIESVQPYWLVDGQKVLLVPKWWVRTRFLFKAHQYLCGIIIERMQQEHGYLNLRKHDIWRNMERDSEHWEYERVIEYTRHNPDALDEYHERMPLYYNRAHGCMSNADLDITVYGHYISETA